MKSISFYLLTLVFIGDPDEDNEIVHFVSLYEDKELAKDDLLIQINEYFKENQYDTVGTIYELFDEKYEDTFRVQLEMVKSKTTTQNSYINLLHNL